MSRYSQAYEEKLNPFNEFSAAERKRKIQSMNLADKLVRWHTSLLHARVCDCLVHGYTTLLYCLCL